MLVSIQLPQSYILWYIYIYIDNIAKESNFMHIYVTITVREGQNSIVTR